MNQNITNENADLNIDKNSEDKQNIDKFWDFVGKLMRLVLNFFLKPFHKELSDKAYISLLQFVKFGVVGVSNTIISYGLYTVSLIIMEKYGIFSKADYVIAEIISFVLSVLWSFYWNNKMVFVVEDGKKRSFWPALIKTYISYSFTGLFLNTILLIMWVQLFNVSEFIAPLLNIVISTPINFFINKLWAFKTKDK